MKPVAEAPVTDWNTMVGARPDLPPNDIFASQNAVDKPIVESFACF
jgi:hypothetical protein